MTNTYRYKLQLVDANAGVNIGPAITGSGGKMMVTTAGSPTRATLTDSSGASLTQPISLTRGSVEFYTTSTSVDIFCQCPDGQFACVYGVTPDGVNEVRVDRSNAYQMMVIPLTFADDSADNTETATGFTEPTGAIFIAPGAGVLVTAIDATETLDVGTLSSDGGDADGFLSAIDIATAGRVLDNGALLGAGASSHVGAGKSITFTFSAGVDTAKLYAFLPYVLQQVTSPTPS